jgi:hypothetical protein
MQRKQILSLVMIAIATAGATRAFADDPIDVTQAPPRT